MNRKAFLKDVAAVILIVVVAAVVLMIISPGFRAFFLGFMSVLSKYEPSEISNSRYFAIMAENAGIDTTALKNCAVDANDKNIIRCSILRTHTSNIVYPQLKIFVNVKNEGTKMRTLYAKPLIGLDCESISKCASRDFLQSTKACTVVPGQTEKCAIQDNYVFKKKGTYKIYPGYMCDVTATDGCFTPGATKPAESYNGKSWITVVVTETT